MDWPGRRATPRTGQFSVEGKLGGRPAGARERAEAAGKEWRQEECCSMFGQARRQRRRQRGKTSPFGKIVCNEEGRPARGGGGSKINSSAQLTTAWRLFKSPPPVSFLFSVPRRRLSALSCCRAATQWVEDSKERGVWGVCVCMLVCGFVCGSERRERDREL